eukprot:TRINITY_DN17151_c0_g1_i1.p1 TRINITY_DN17151_c0_g1~~TRINITY_DN17151_c0_g1_i1.p1  ORF type:complete len:518 (+),score=94.33 TRINITY_DN17151_c0_g1_i1:129-1682(+)
MIEYDTGTWGVGFIFQRQGSVLPKALCWAIPNAILAVICHYLLHDEGLVGAPSSTGDEIHVLGTGNMEKVWGSYTFVLGFLVVFRNNQAYNKLWQGASELSEIRGTWFGAMRELCAFCNPAAEMRDKVNDFQELLIKLASMLFCTALQQVCELQDDRMEVLDLSGIDPDKLLCLEEAEVPSEMIMQWILHLIVESDKDNILSVAPPILSRVFQGLSNGMVKLQKVSCIKEVPFPFPYAQMITAMLLVHWLLTPLFASQVVQSAWWAGILCFCVSGAFWWLLYIALEIDQPFGEDPNDLPVKEMMAKWNASLQMLRHPAMATRPSYVQEEPRVGAQVMKKTIAIERVLSVGSVKSCIDLESTSVIPEPMADLRQQRSQVVMEQNALPTFPFDGLSQSEESNPAPEFGAGHSAAAMKTLLESRVNPAVTNDNGAPSLVIATEKNSVETTKQLRDPERANHNDATPIFVAAESVETTRQLLEAKASLEMAMSETANQDDGTPIFFAAAASVAQWRLQRSF